MRYRILALVGVLVAVIIGVSLPTIPVAAQVQTPAPKAKTWTPSRTADGQPDLQGMWLNFDSTPFETPAAPGRGDAASVSENAPGGAGGRAGGRAAAAGGAPAVVAAPAAPPVVSGFTEIGSINPRNARRRSLVVDPPDGRVPVMASAEQKRDYNLAHLGDSWEHHGPWERCITRSVPGGIFPTGYNSAYQIQQGPGYVAIVYEMIHEARIIPVDGSPHLPQNIRLWNGDSRGHWEGNTLVVDITNYTDKGSIATNAATGRIKGIPQSEALHVVERFTRVDANAIDYEVTIEDPKVYTRPWKVAIPLNRDDTYQMYEYACHEGNQNYMTSALGGGRLQDKAAEDVAKKK